MNDKTSIIDDIAETGIRRRTALKVIAAGFGGFIAGPGLFTSAALAQEGGTLTVGTLGDILSFDGFQYGTQNYVLMRQVYDHLLDYTDSFGVSSKVLESWAIADDKGSVTLKLKPGVRLQAGRDWSAADLVQAFERAANPDTGRQLNGPSSFVASATAEDDLTVLLTFKAPTGEATVTDLLVMVPVTAAEGNVVEALDAAPCGSGAYQLESRLANDSITLVRFADYSGPATPGFERIVIRIFDNADALAAALETGAIDVANRLPSLAGRRLADRVTILEGFVGSLVDGFRFNPLSEAFPLPLRKAFRRAIDRDRIVSEVYLYGRPALLPWAPTSPAATDRHDADLSFDLGAAKAFWEEAGSPAEVEVLADGGSQDELKVLQIVQADLAKIGLNMIIVPMDGGALWDRALAGDFNAFYGTAGNFGKRSPAAVVSNSFMRVADNVVWRDQLPQSYVDAIAAVRTASTDTEMSAASAMLNQVIMDECWFAPVVLMTTLFASGTGTTGVGRDIDDRLDLTAAASA